VLLIDPGRGLYGFRGSWGLGDRKAVIKVCSGGRPEQERTGRPNECFLACPASLVVMETRSNKDQGSLFAIKKAGKGRAIFVERATLTVLLAGLTLPMTL
jgi:hypothetical protein